ncbi:DNA-directed RNA polymerase III subunit RPC3 [Striga asiatica]|uniref:DNA-directed RNA polymerase III subunit RPC3 n=1 Tax=Striga asiatica TaxID=4170 RepID=A0A5A7R0X9_STRAF|nr:DNA-directed RNA polymerase III subunit RPC3 [Striga asiatica]
MEPPPPPHGIQFATHLISTFYGDLCSKVCECLLRRGSLTVGLIIKHTHLSRENVINCLRVLIHQNCVQAFSFQRNDVFGEPPKVITQYMALFNNVMHKSRAPKFLQIVSDELGEDCLGIFQGLIQHGRLSFKQIIERKEETTGVGSLDIDALRETFNRLLNARFVERCPAPDPFLAPLEDESAAKKRGSKLAKLNRIPPKEQRAIEAAAPLESMRFLMEMDENLEKNDEENGKSVSVGEKRKRALNSDEDVLDPDDEKKEVLWRVNFEEFMRHMRKKACVSYVKTKINDEAGIVLGAVLDLNGRSESGQRTENTAYLSLNEIYPEVIKKEGGLGMDLERIKVSLEQLGCEIVSAGLEDTFSIDIRRFVEMAQNEEVESVVMRRHGKEAYRIFRLLSKSGRLVETDKIAESTFVDKKVAIQILYKLWKDEFVYMETLTATGAGRPTKFHVWGVDKHSLWDQVLDEMYHAALNLRLRIAHEYERGKEVLQLPREKLVGEFAKKYQLALKVRSILENSSLSLDNAIMLFHCY